MTGPGADISVRVARDGPGIRVTWRGEMAGDELDEFRNILADLVDGQGNLTVAVELPDIVVVDLRLLEALVEVEQRLAARSGTLSVETRTGVWRPAAKAVVTSSD